MNDLPHVGDVLERYVKGATHPLREQARLRTVCTTWSGCDYVRVRCGAIGRVGDTMGSGARRARIFWPVPDELIVNRFALGATNWRTRFTFDDAVRGVSRDGRLAMCGTAVADASSGAPLAELKNACPPVDRFNYSSRADASFSCDNGLVSFGTRVFDAHTGRLVFSRGDDDRSYAMMHCAFSPTDPSRCVVQNMPSECWNNQLLTVLDVEGGTPSSTILLHAKASENASTFWLPDGNALLHAQSNGDFEVIDMRATGANTTVYSTNGYPDAARAWDLSRDGARLVCGLRDGRLRAFDLRHTPSDAAFRHSTAVARADIHVQGGGCAVSGIALSPDARFVAAIDKDTRACVVDADVLIRDYDRASCGQFAQ